MSAAFLTGEQRQTQVLEHFTYLYSQSFPDITVSGWSYRAHKTEGDAGWTTSLDSVEAYCHDRQGNPAKLASLRVGLFRDQKLVQWFAEEEQDGFDGAWRHFSPEEGTVLLEAGHSYCIAAVVKDEFDREWVVADPRCYAVTVDTLDTVYSEPSRDPADWEY